ncbi:MAG: DUF3352 domain-containing protein [Actinomycetota bacterium]|nr:DUF3352 domain-containing protein [Actinomycetota bacterium]
MKTKPLLLTVAALVLVAGAAVAYVRFMAPAEDEAIGLVPKSSILYGNVFIRPSNDQKMALDDLLQKFPGVENTDDALNKLIELLDEQLGKEGLSYEEDIEPWLGDQIGGFIMPGGPPELPNFGILIESKDDDALRDFIDRVQQEEDPEAEIVEREYKGTTYEVVDDPEEPAAFVFLDGFLVGGTEEAIKASIDARDGESLQDSEKFLDATDSLRDEWLGLFYADSNALLSLIEQDPQMTPEDRAIFDNLDFGDLPPWAGVAYVTSDSIGFENSGGSPTEGPFAGFSSFTGPGLLLTLPGESWAAFGVPDVGGLVTESLELFADFPGFNRDQIESAFTSQTGLDLEEDVLSWMGDAGLFVQGTNLQELGGGLVVESSDADKTSALLDTAERMLTQQGIQPRPTSEGDLEGFSMQAPGMPAPVYFLGGERLVITYGQSATQQAVTPEQPLAEAESFVRASDELGSDFDAGFFVDVDAAQAFAEAMMSFSGQIDPTYEEEVRPYLEPFGYIVAGSRTDDDEVVRRFVIGVP